MPISYQITVLVHVVAAVVWVGGVLFIGGVALPASRTLPDEQGRQVVQVLGRYFRPVGWTALAILVATGLHMAWVWGARPANVLNGGFFDTIRNEVLGLKLALVALLLVTSGLHDWYVGPRASQLADEDGEGARRWRIASGVLGGATALLSVLVVLLAAFVARPWMTFGY